MYRIEKASDEWKINETRTRKVVVMNVGKSRKKEKGFPITNHMFYYFINTPQTSEKNILPPSQAFPQLATPQRRPTQKWFIQNPFFLLFSPPSERGISFKNRSIRAENMNGFFGAHVRRSRYEDAEIVVVWMPFLLGQRRNNIKKNFWRAFSFLEGKHRVVMSILMRHWKSWLENAIEI